MRMTRPLHITEQTDYSALPWPPAPFCALVIAPDPINENAKSNLSHALVDAGCISMGAWGPDSSAWDDAGDYACILTADLQLRNTPVDMITWWFDRDPLDTAIEFAKRYARCNDHAPLLILTFDPNLGFGAALA